MDQFICPTSMGRGRVINRLSLSCSYDEDRDSVSRR